MGGAVAVTLREPDGTEHRMCRWTNGLPWMLVNIGLYEKRPEHIAAIIKAWEEMKNDWRLHKDEPFTPEREFEFPMTPTYAPYGMLAPHGYGLVVMDMKHDEILTLQGYTSFDNLHACDARYSEDLERFDALHKAGRITGVSEYKSSGGWIMRALPSIEDIRLLEEKDILSVRKYPVDTSPFKIRVFEENLRGLAALKAAVLGLGFILTEEEETAWDSHEEYFEDEEEE